jgi:uncharacterized protein
MLKIEISARLVMQLTLARCNSMNAVVENSGNSVTERIQSIDWQLASRDADAQGSAVLERLFSPNECETIAGLYTKEDTFRARMVLAPHGFGRGEYKYFNYPLPDLIATVRTAVYPDLAPIANRWNTAMGIAIQYPEEHAEFIARCHRTGQARPTPLLLQYGAGDYNCLHQDLYGNMFSRFSLPSSYRGRIETLQAGNS